MSRRVCIERLTDATMSSERLTTDDVRAVEACASLARRREVAAWRNIVRRELGAEVRISYNADGAPAVDADNIYIGVTHSRNFAAVAFSDRPCAVDTEPVGRTFERVLSRYLTPQEAALSDNALWHAAAWCAKEALYKVARRRGISLVGDIVLRKVDFERHIMQGEVCGTHYDLHIYSVEEDIFVCIL